MDQGLAQRRICVLANQDHTTHPIIRRQLKTLQAAGYHVTVVDQGDTSAPREPFVRRVRPVSIAATAKFVWRVLRRVDEQRLGEPWWTLVYFLQVLLTATRYWAVAVRQRSDFYQAHDLETLLPALAAARVRRRPVIYDAHELTSEQGDPRSMRKAVERWIERRLVPRVDYVIAPNAARSRIYARRCELRNPPVVIRNCPPSTEVPRSDLLRQQLGLSADVRIVVYHGSLMQGRALDHLVAATREFDTNISLVLIGAESPFFQTVLVPLVESMPEPRRVHFIPFVEPDRVLDYVASADLGVVIYQNVNLNNYLCAPTKLYEYLMVGLPVVTSNFPEMLELFEQFPVGLPFNPDDPSSIAAAINLFFRTREQNSLEMESALRRARQQFTWEQESRKLLDIFANAA
jgi:glycosyltransferase involved in cell wall biosynthesis